MKTEVYQRGQPHFDMCGKFLGYPLHITDECISEGLAQRLLRYVLKRAEEDGFKFIASWEATVFTTDAEDKPADRWYGVTFRNERGGYVQMGGILTNHGWPFLDHGWEMGTE